MSKLSRVEISRRRFLQASAAGAGSLGAWSVLGTGTSAQAAVAAPPPIPFNSGWLFGGVYQAGSEQPGYDDGAFHSGLHAAHGPAAELAELGLRLRERLDLPAPEAKLPVARRRSL